MKDITITSCLESVLENMDDETVSTEEEYGYLNERMGLSREQALLFAAILELSISGEGTPEHIARKLKCSNLHFLNLKGSLDELVARRMVRVSTRGFRGLNYRVPDQAIKSIQNNEVPNCDDISNLSPEGLTRRFNGLFREFYRDSIDRETLVAELRDLLKYSPENSVVKAYNAAGIPNMSDNEELLLLFMITRQCNFDEDTWGMEEFSKVFMGDINEDEIPYGLKHGTLSLFRDGIIEYVNVDGIADKEHIRLTQRAKDSLLAEMPAKCAEKPACRNVIAWNTISRKDLFYNEAEGKQVETLESILSQENFRKVVDRLKEKGMRSGFACLFHGSAGTGKTATAYEIARRTGRDIFLVDVSHIKSKWVGDSEKNIRALFEEYRQQVRSSEVAPILLFNEADAIFGVRKKGAENAVDKMENSVQNIILQEMEDLEGILIATTNLTQNLDPAFERRFLYKIQFNRPGTEVKTKIWESLVEGMDEKTASALACEYDFSGGQIENISRKMTVDYILSGTTPELDGIRELCANENIESKKSGRGRIGF